jgi:rsbT co-antagonist protein RsbR
MKMRSGLQRRLMLALGLLSLLLLVVTSTALLTLHYVVGAGLRSAQRETTVSQLANDVAVRALLCRRYEKDLLLNIDNPAERARALKEWERAHAELARAIDAFSRATTSDEDLRQVEIWRAALRFYRDGLEQTADGVKSGRIRSTPDALGVFQPIGENITTLTDLAVTTSEGKRKLAEGAGRRLEQLGLRVIAALAATGAAALTFASAWSLWFPKQLIRPIVALRDAAMRLAGGDLAARARVESQDELGELAARFNQMAETIEQRSGELEAQYKRSEAARSEADAARARITEQLETIKAQQALIRDMSVPILPLSDTTLVIPLVGEMDSERLALAQERALEALSKSAARFLILDVTAVPVVDTNVADGLIRLVRAAELLGARTVLVGIRPEVAMSLVNLGVDLGRMITQRSLQSGISYTTAKTRREAAHGG